MRLASILSSLPELPTTLAMNAARASEVLAEVGLVRHQGPMIKTLARTAALAVGQKLGRRKSLPDLPGPEVVQTVPARPPELIARYLAHLEAGQGWGDALPNHLFPQWSFPALAKTLEQIPYPLGDLLNGGAKMISHRPLPMGEALTTRARLMRIDDDGKRAVMHQHMTTGTASAPHALEVEFRAVVRRNGGSDKKGREKPTVPEDTMEIGRWELTSRSGLEFALLTGDFNPIHWVPLAARAAGFKNTILHGFASMSRAAEALTSEHGDGQALAMLDVRFVQPLVLPRFPGDNKGVTSIGCFVRDQEVFVGTAAGGPAFMVGTYTLR